MNIELSIKGDLKEYCIACLEKSPNMLNLKENAEKKELFTKLFNVEVKFLILFLTK